MAHKILNMYTMIMQRFILKNEGYNLKFFLISTACLISGHGMGIGKEHGTVDRLCRTYPFEGKGYELNNLPTVLHWSHDECQLLHVPFASHPPSLLLFLVLVLIHQNASEANEKKEPLSSNRTDKMLQKTDPSMPSDNC